MLNKRNEHTGSSGDGTADRMQHNANGVLLGTFVPHKLKFYFTGDECFLHLSQAQHSTDQKQVDFTSTYLSSLNKGFAVICG